MEREEVVFKKAGGQLTARICCDIDHHTARATRERIDAELFLEKPSVLELDFSDVGFMDSSGLALILGRAECASVVGARLHLSGLSEAQYKLVRLGGIEKIKNLTVSKR